MYTDIDYYDVLDDTSHEKLEAEQLSTTFSYLLEYCIKPTVYDASLHIGRLFVCCIIFRLIAQSNISLIWKHTASTIIGMYVMYSYFNEWMLHVILMAVVFYIGIQIIFQSKGMVILLLTFLFLVANELAIQNDYTKIRGTEMVLGMKLVSLAFDVQHSADNMRMRNKMPNFIEFTGYMFCVGTCIFGPWISYIEYVNMLNRDDMTYQSLLKILRSFICCLLFFILSVCLVEWIIPDNSHSWLLVYRDALLFRCGHYFVSFLSDTTISLAGYSSLDSICHPKYIEFPRSLSQVVVHWNVSMHKWLKYYVFRTSSEFGRFASVLITYVVSALMHGLNYRLAGVLISLGFYTYIEYSVRHILARKFNACIGAKSCPVPCRTHKFTDHILIVALFNLVFSLLSIFHLAYLGAVIDTSTSKVVSFTDAFDRWRQLDFISHWIAFLTFVFYWVIK